MKRLALLIVLLSVCAVRADDYHQRGNYWYYGTESTPYYRSYVTTPGYYAYGVYYPGRSYYSYYATTIPTVAAPATPYNWQKQVLDIRKSQDDNKAYIDALKSLGPVQLPYGQATIPPYVLDGQYSSQHTYGLYGANATTRYGYLDAAAINLNPLVNLDQRLQQFGQITANAQSVASKTTDDFGGLIGQAGSGQQRLAEIIAKSQAAAQIIRAMDGPPQQTQQQYTFRQTPATVQVTPTQPPVPYQAPMMPYASERAQLLQQHMAAKCASCHSASVKKGGFDAATYPSLTNELKKAVKDYVTAKKCPQVPGGAQGAPLTPAELQLYE